MIPFCRCENYIKWKKILLQTSDVILLRRFIHASLLNFQNNSRLQQCYNLLGLDNTASIDDVKLRFSQLAKQYHPDTGKEEADKHKMEELHSAYKYIVKANENPSQSLAMDQQEESEEDKFDIRHTAPQHRQYLEYGGVGRGKPAARQKQYQQYRVHRAVENTQEFMINKTIQDSYNDDSAKSALILKTREQNYFSKKHKVTGMIERVVEDLILSSMANGDFQNLKGSGQPLKQDCSNPYIDDTEKRINDLLKTQGFTPPWIMKASEIRECISDIRSKLRLEYARFVLSQKAPYNDTITFSKALSRWRSTEDHAEKSIMVTNRSIDDYNLINPLKNHCYFFKLNLVNESGNAKREIDENPNNSKFIEEARKGLEIERKYNSSNSFSSNIISRLFDNFNRKKEEKRKNFV